MMHGFTLVVTSHGRWPYLGRTLGALDALGLEFDRRILSLDGDTDAKTVGGQHGWEILTTGERKGLTANLAQAWGALTEADDYVLHLEEDFVLHEAPLREMADTLDAYRHVANMVLVRQPWGPHEFAAGSVLKAQRSLIDRGGWLEHRNGFWLNPMVAHASLLRSLTPGLEQDLTAQCLARKLSFGYWGAMDDPPRCEHIGAEGGMGSPGWLG